jgi:hypothetical protein
LKQETESRHFHRDRQGELSPTPGVAGESVNTKIALSEDVSNSALVKREEKDAILAMNMGGVDLYAPKIQETRHQSACIG